MIVAPWVQADKSNRQLYSIKPTNGPSAVPNVIGREICIQNVGRAGEGLAKCATYPAVDSPTHCATTSVSLKSVHPTTGSTASWILEDAGAPGVVYIYSKVGKDTSIRDSCFWSAA